MATTLVRPHKSKPKGRIVYVGGRAEAYGANPPPNPRPGTRRWELVIAGVAAFAVVASVVVAAVFGLLGQQNTNHLQKEQNSLQRALNGSHFGEVMIRLDQYFAEHPELRKYFYADPVETQPPHAIRLRAQAMSTAEMLIDFADNVAFYVREGKMPQKDAATGQGLWGRTSTKAP
jgi:hypothetical protein